MKLTVAARGKEPVVVWRRGGWTSMPHLIDRVNGPMTTTRCGCDVLMGQGITGMVITKVASDLFLAAGCGACRMGIMRDLRKELLAARPDARRELKELLGGLDWTTEIPAPLWAVR